MSLPTVFRQPLKDGCFHSEAEREKERETEGRAQPYLTALPQAVAANAPAIPIPTRKGPNQSCN